MSLNITNQKDGKLRNMLGKPIRNVKDHVYSMLSDLGIFLLVTLKDNSNSSVLKHSTTRRLG